MSNPQMIPMIAPDGTVGEIPSDKVTAALANKFRLGVKMQAPSGDIGIIPRDNIVQALQTPGMKVLADSAGYAVQTRTPTQIAQSEDSMLGGFSRIPGNLWGGAKALATAPFTNPITGQVDISNPAENIVGNLYVKPAVESAEHVSNVAAQHGKTGTALEAGGRAIAAVPFVGPWVMGTDQQKGLAERNSAGGILTEGLGTIVAGEGLTRGISKAASAVDIPSPADAIANRRTRSVRAAVPEAANLPAQAVSGAEKIYRAAAPTGGDPQFRANLYAAAGDLAEIGRNLDLSQPKGGWFNPDLRVRATVNAINDHLSNLYADERAPQIARNASAQVVPELSADAADGLDYLSRNAGKSADRTLAEKALNADSISVADLDALERSVSRELAPLRGATPQEIALAEGNSKKLASLQALHEDLNRALETELSNRGEGGISQYSRRYAALSQIRDRLRRQMSMSELQRRNPITDNPVGKLIGLARKPSIAGASQAATANVNIGRMLQQGLDELASSGLQPKRASGPNPPQVRGLLGPGATQLPAPMEPTEPGPQGVLPAAKVTVRDPRTGKMRRMYVTSPDHDFLNNPESWNNQNRY